MLRCLLQSSFERPDPLTSSSDIGSDIIKRLCDAVGSPPDVADRVSAAIAQPGRYLAGTERGFVTLETSNLGLLVFLDEVLAADRACEFDFTESAMSVLFDVAELVQCWSAEAADVLRFLDLEDVSSVSDAISQSNVHVASFGVMFIEFDIGSDSHPVVECKTADEDAVRRGIAHLE